MAMRTRLPAIVLLLIAGCSCDNASTTPPASKSNPVSQIAWSPEPARVTEDLAVLRAVLENHCLKSDGKYFVLVSDPGELGPLNQPPAEVPAEAAADLVRRNTNSTRLPDGVGCAGIRVATNEEIEATSANRPPDPNRHHLGWEGFYAKYPDAHGLLRLSLPGYASGGRVAVVSTSTSAGLRAGSGRTLVLRKLAGEWRIVERYPGWIA
jgi:hypothetical protein